MEQKYCRHCGSKFEGDTTICIKCGFDGSKGDKFCGNCGKGIEPGQIICTGCGHLLTQEKIVEQPVEKPAEKADEGWKDYFEKKQEPAKKEYMKYSSIVSIINRLKLWENLLVFFMILSLVFAPIYVCKYPLEISKASSMEETVKDFVEALKNDGYVQKNFSLFDDVISIVRWFTDKTIEEQKLKIAASVVTIYCVFFECFFAIVLLASSASKVINSVNQNNAEETLIRYKEIKNSGKASQKVRSFSSIGCFLTMLLLGLLDIILTPTLWMYQLDKIAKNVWEMRKMFYFTGFSPYIATSVICLIGVIILHETKEKETRSLIYQIDREDYI